MVQSDRRGDHYRTAVQSILCFAGWLSEGSLQSLDWNGGMEWWNGIVECVLQGERSLLMQFSMKVTVGVLFLIAFVR